MRFIHLSILALLIASAAPAAGAMTLAEAKAAYELGDFAEAAPVLAEHAAQHPKDAALNSMAGIALFYSGREADAVPFLKKGANDANLFLAQEAMHRYDFDAAEEYVDRYEDGFKRRKRDPRPERPEAEPVRASIEKGRGMLDRVEQLVIIDSLCVDRETFFRHYRLSAPTGSLHPAADLPRQFEAADPTVVYATERADEIFWAMPDENENFRIATSTLLADDTWEKPTLLPDLLNEGGDANYPFMMSDGVTLYYANTGENSLGGYDIFISRRDGDTYYQPQNLGMPYNSYANDYMLAIDELTGAGWWATDRNSPADSVTIYVFVPSELRVNYPVETPDLTARALVTDYRATWPEGADYSDKLSTIAHLRRSDQTEDDTFRFAMPTRGVYTSLDDFRRPEARQLMQQYLKARHNFDLDRRKLQALRLTYSRGNTSVADEILAMEADVERLRDEMQRLSNQVVAAELK